MLWTLPEYFNSDSASSLFLFLIAMSHLKFTASSGSPKYHTHICQTEMRYDMVVKKVLKNQFHEFLFFCQILSWIILLLKKINSYWNDILFESDARKKKKIPWKLHKKNNEMHSTAYSHIFLPMIYYLPHTTTIVYALDQKI